MKIRLCLALLACTLAGAACTDHRNPTGAAVDQRPRRTGEQAPTTSDAPTDTTRRGPVIYGGGH